MAAGVCRAGRPRRGGARARAVARAHFRLLRFTVCDVPFVKWDITMTNGTSQRRASRPAATCGRPCVELCAFRYTPRGRALRFRFTSNRPLRWHGARRLSHHLHLIYIARSLWEWSLCGGVHAGLSSHHRSPVGQSRSRRGSGASPATQVDVARGIAQRHTHDAARRPCRAVLRAIRRCARCRGSRHREDCQECRGVVATATAERQRIKRRHRARRHARRANGSIGGTAPSGAMPMMCPLRHRQGQRTPSAAPACASTATLSRRVHAPQPAGFEHLDCTQRARVSIITATSPIARRRRRTRAARPSGGRRGLVLSERAALVQRQRPRGAPRLAACVHASRDSPRQSFAAAASAAGGGLGATTLIEHAHLAAARASVGARSGLARQVSRTADAEDFVRPRRRALVSWRRCARAARARAARSLAPSPCETATYG